MFLYELALELDEKSGDLAEFAAGIGIPDLSAPSTLTREQVAAIRAAKAGHPMAAAAYGGVGDDSSPVAWAPPGQDPPPGIPAVDSPHGDSHGDSHSGAPGAPGEKPGWPMVGESDEPKTAKSHLAIIGVAVVLALTLFGYMVTNTGDDAKANKLAAENAAADAKVPETVAPIVTSTTATTSVGSDVPLGAPPAETPPGSDVPVDRAAFCRGAAADRAYQTSLDAAGMDLQANLAAMRDGRAAFTKAIDDLLAGAAPSVKPVVESYRDGWEHIVAVSLQQGAVGGIDHEGARALTSAYGQLKRVVAVTC